MARIRVALRRMTNTPDEPILQVENLKMDVAHRLVTVNGAQISLTPTEYEILRLLYKMREKYLHTANCFDRSGEQPTKPKCTFCG